MENTQIYKSFFAFFIILTSACYANKQVLKPTFVNELVTVPNKVKALIFGITGQDGAYLTKLLLDKDYAVYGMTRRSSATNMRNLNHILKDSPDQYKNITLLYGDITDFASVHKIIKTVQPDEIYNLAAQSHVKISFEEPIYTSQVDALGTLYILEAIRQAGLEKKTKFFQASTSELFGKTQQFPQTETTSFHPRSPYGIAKLFAYWVCRNYRETYNMYTCNGILYNHESPYRGDDFVTKIICEEVAKIKLGLQDCFAIGNLNATRDWGFAQDYVEAIWLMLQQHTPDDYVIATGTTHTVREFIETACTYIGIDLSWHGDGLNECGINKKTGKIVVRVDQNYYGSTETELLIGDATKACQTLGWKPKISFETLIKLMIDNAIENLQVKE